MDKYIGILETLPPTGTIEAVSPVPIGAHARTCSLPCPGLQAPFFGRQERLLFQLHFYRALGGFAVRGQHSAQFGDVEARLPVNRFSVAESLEACAAVIRAHSARAHATER